MPDKQPSTAQCRKDSPVQKRQPSKKDRQTARQSIRQAGRQAGRQADQCRNDRTAQPSPVQCRTEQQSFTPCKSTVCTNIRQNSVERAVQYCINITLFYITITLHSVPSITITTVNVTIAIKYYPYPEDSTYLPCC